MLRAVSSWSTAGASRPRPWRCSACLIKPQGRVSSSILVPVLVRRHLFGRPGPGPNLGPGWRLDRARPDCLGGIRSSKARTGWRLRRVGGDRPDRSADPVRYRPLAPASLADLPVIGKSPG